MTSQKHFGQVKEITSLANPIIKDMKSLSQKKNRDRDGVFMAEGLKLVIDALDLGWTIRSLLFAKAGLGNPLIEKTAARTKAAGGLVIEANQKVMESVTRRDNPQMVVGVFEQRWIDLSSLTAKGDDVYVALDRIRDPGNLGTIIRTADAVGAKGLILVGDTTDPYSLETVRATMGSIFALPLYRSSGEQFLEWRSQFRGKIIGTHLKGSVDYRTIDYGKEPTILFMGNEQQGLPDNLADSCDMLARIPQAGRADSLNLAIATGVMLYEIRRKSLTLDPREARS
ncbi:RNA methyltransferase [uncultured Bartonella sp.]|uniref:TrmH family RNA methyltransferase n=1 Tax=uncultured Bartonella sp. TaxID=104108 RepID=UPI00262B2428|nr:RNA methyltransferase [uncultured Bartonella sp.]